jgi:integrase/recombinase XerC
MTVLMLERKQQIRSEPEQGSMRAMVEQYFRWKDLAVCSEHTKKAYHFEVSRLMNFLGEDSPTSALNCISLHHFSIELCELGLAPRSRRRALAYVRDLVRWAAQAGIYPDNFAISLKLPRLPKSMPEVPTESEVRSLLSAETLTSWPLRDHCIAEVLYCNLRVCEVAAIQLDDISGDQLLVKGKGRRERTVFLTESARTAISQYLPTRTAILLRRHADTAALFINARDGTGLTVKSIHRIIKLIAHFRGLPKTVSPIKLRGAYATHLLDRGAPLSAVSQLLGHEKLSTTMHYVGAVSPKRMRERYDETFKR